MADTITVDMLHDAILDTLSDALPEFSRLAAYPRERDKISTPAGYLCMPGFEPGKDDGTERTGVHLRWELSVFLAFTGRSEAVQRAIRANIANIVCLISGNRFGLHIAPAVFLSAAEDGLKPGTGRYAEWTVEFATHIMLGESVWDTDAVTPVTILASHSPLIGAGSEEYYQEVDSVEF